jgi:hypothetical protein
LNSHGCLPPAAGARGAAAGVARRPSGCGLAQCDAFAVRRVLCGGGVRRWGACHAAYVVYVLCCVALRMLRMLCVALHMLYVGAAHLLAPPAAIMQHPESSHSSSPCDSCGTFQCCKHAPDVHRPARSTPPAASSEPENQSPRDGVGTPPTRASARECSAQGSPSALPEIPSHQSPAVSAPPLGRPRKGFRAEQKRLLRPRGVVKDQLQSAAALTRAELYGGA